MRSIVLLFAAALVAVCFAAASGPQAAAQAQCQTVQVTGIRPERVQLYTLQGVRDQEVPRDQLGAITSAVECPNTSFMMIETPLGRRLVHRVALQLPSTIELPECASGQFASQDTRNASSSGLGGRACRPAGTPANSNK